MGWRAWLARVRARRVRARLTVEGWWFSALMVGVLVAALNTGNSLLFLVLAAQCAALVLSNVLAEWNLRGLGVARRLPSELFAGQPSPGALVLHNRRRIGAAFAVHLAELGDPLPPDPRPLRRAPPRPRLAEAAVAHAAPGARVEAPTRWVFSARGPARLSAIEVSSTFPFGLVRRWRELPAPAELLVYPVPAGGPPAWGVAAAAGARPVPHLRGRSGDFEGLRGYVPGDPLRDLHWPTTARTGKPMVVQRSAERADEVMVEVADLSGPAWEAALSRATGAVVRHFRLGHAVGLAMGGRRLSPAPGELWRRHLLGLLAVAPTREHK